MPLAPAAYTRDPRFSSSCTPVEIPFFALNALVVTFDARPVTSVTPRLVPFLAMTETNASPRPSSTSEFRYAVQSATHCHDAPSCDDDNAHRSRPRPKLAAYRYLPSVASRLPVARGLPISPGRFVPSKTGGAPLPECGCSTHVTPSSSDSAIPPLAPSPTAANQVVPIGRIAATR